MLHGMCRYVQNAEIEGKFYMERDLQKEAEKTAKVRHSGGSDTGAGRVLSWNALARCAHKPVEMCIGTGRHIKYTYSMYHVVHICQVCGRSTCA